MRGPTGRRLQRVPRRRWIGGVCAGLAEFLGLDVVWVRLGVLVSMFFSFSLTFWAYLALWIVLPSKPEVPMPHVSRRYRKELNRIDRLVRKVHRRLEPQVADRAQSVLDGLKLLAGELESATVPVSTVTAAWDRARRRLPLILQELLASAGVHRRLTDELEELDRDVRRASREALELELRDSAAKPAGDDAAVRLWREKLVPLRERLRRHAGPQTLATLQGIEEKLSFLLSRSESGELMDLSPFEVRKIGFDYLPDTLSEYLKLPHDMARSKRLPGGLTAEEALNDQLIRLDQTLEDLATSVFERDAQGLLIQGRFLKNKFADQPFRLKD